MEGIKLRETSGKGRKTLALSMSEKVFSLVSHMFEETMPNHFIGRHEITISNFNIYKWNLNAYRLSSTVNGQITHCYEIYGSCGDSSFGHSPFWYAKKYSGNIRAARKLYTRFVDYIEKNQPKLIGQKFGL